MKNKKPAFMHWSDVPEVLALIGFGTWLVLGPAKPFINKSLESVGLASQECYASLIKNEDIPQTGLLEDQKIVMSLDPVIVQGNKPSLEEIALIPQSATPVLKDLPIQIPP